MEYIQTKVPQPGNDKDIPPYPVKSTSAGIQTSPCEYSLLVAETHHILQRVSTTVVPVLRATNGKPKKFSDDKFSEK